VFESRVELVAQQVLHRYGGYVVTDYVAAYAGHVQ